MVLLTVTPQGIAILVYGYGIICEPKVITVNSELRLNDCCVRVFGFSLKY